MKEVNMDIEWRTIQLFLGNEGVSEVSIDFEDRRKLSCTCDKFAMAARCKHTKFVREAMDSNGGDFNIDILGDVSHDDAVDAMTNAKAFREFIIKYGAVEVID